MAFAIENSWGAKDNSKEKTMNLLNIKFDLMRVLLYIGWRMDGELLVVPLPVLLRPNYTILVKIKHLG